MNIELKPRTISFMVPAPASANDNAEQWRGTAPPRPRVLIYKPAKSATTSGRAGTKRWMLEFEPQSPPFIEPLMGWTGSADPMSRVRLAFPTREAAVAYARRQGLVYELREPASQVKTSASVGRQESRPMANWSADLLSDRNSPAVSEIRTTGSAPSLAA